MTVLTEHGGWAVDDVIDDTGMLKDVEVRGKTSLTSTLRGNTVQTGTHYFLRLSCMRGPGIIRTHLIRPERPTPPNEMLAFDAAACAEQECVHCALALYPPRSLLHHF